MAKAVDLCRLPKAACICLPALLHLQPCRRQLKKVQLLPLALTAFNHAFSTRFCVPVRVSPLPLLSACTYSVKPLYHLSTGRFDPLPEPKHFAGAIADSSLDNSLKNTTQ